MRCSEVTWRMVPSSRVIDFLPITLGEGANHATTIHTPFANSPDRMQKNAARRIRADFRRDFGSEISAEDRSKLPMRAAARTEQT